MSFWPIVAGFMAGCWLLIQDLNSRAGGVPSLPDRPEWRQAQLMWRRPGAFLYHCLSPLEGSASTREVSLCTSQQPSVLFHGAPLVPYNLKVAMHPAGQKMSCLSSRICCNLGEFLRPMTATYDVVHSVTSLFIKLFIKLCIYVYLCLSMFMPCLSMFNGV